MNDAPEPRQPDAISRWLGDDAPRPPLLPEPNRAELDGLLDRISYLTSDAFADANHPQYRRHVVQRFGTWDDWVAIEQQQSERQQRTNHARLNPGRFLAQHGSIRFGPDQLRHPIGPQPGPSWLTSTAETSPRSYEVDVTFDRVDSEVLRLLYGGSTPIDANTESPEENGDRESQPDD